MQKKLSELSNKEQEYLVQDALELITQKLAHIVDEPKPTLFHCVRVGTWLYQQWYDLEIVLWWYLHDMLEDSDVTYEELVDRYGQEVAEIVKANTVDQSISDKSQRKSEVVDRCLAHSKQSAIVMWTEILDGLQYYIRESNAEQLANKIEKARIFLEKNSHADKVFDQLLHVCGQ